MNDDQAVLNEIKETIQVGKGWQGHGQRVSLAGGHADLPTGRWASSSDLLCLIPSPQKRKHPAPVIHSLCMGELYCIMFF